MCQELNISQGLIEANACSVIYSSNMTTILYKIHSFIKIQ
jgi:hypothetical protein